MTDKTSSSDPMYVKTFTCKLLVYKNIQKHANSFEYDINNVQFYFISFISCNQTKIPIYNVNDMPVQLKVQ